VAGQLRALPDNVHRGNGKVQVWDVGLHDAESIPAETRAVFGKFLFPLGDEPGRDPETFYTADFLADRGFRVVTCPSSSCYGDNVFGPRNWFHMVNTFDSFQKGMAAHLEGSVLTSWTVHLFPYELQLACIAIPAYLAANPDGTIEGFQRWFAESRFGLSEPDAFFRACGLLSKSCLFTHTSSLGFSKNTLPVPIDHAKKMIQDTDDRAFVDTELNNCTDRLQEYREALGIFDELAQKAAARHELLEAWRLAARNLINRAQASALLLGRAQEVEQGTRMDAEERAHAAAILAEMRALKEQTRAAYAEIYKPTRCAEAIGWMFDSVEHALAEVADSLLHATRGCDGPQDSIQRTDPQDLVIGQGHPVALRTVCLQDDVAALAVHDAVAKGPLQRGDHLLSGNVTWQLHRGLTTSSRTR